MDQPPKTGKRIVSKGQYLINTGKKATLSSLGTMAFLFGTLGAALTCIFAIILFSNVFGRPMPDSFSGMIVLGFVGGGSAILLYLGSKAVKKGSEIDVGIPFTRANTADLPAAESLVRASEQPLVEQKAILLRAATSGTDTPTEELVRATVGPQNTEA